jgi:hypothetical protein
VERAARGEKPDGKLNELPRSGYKTKADVVKVLRSSFDGVIAGVKSMPEAEVIKHLDLWTAFLIHSGEHYGQSVIYYRLNGLVPPESRK